MMMQRRTIVILVAALGGAVALVGGYWDDAWHTDRGRDSLFAAPHVLLYVGVSLATVAVGLLGARPWSAAQRLALGGGGAVLLSAPLDEAWHVAFGRDAVLWSPPHMFAVVASLMLATGVLALATRTSGRLAVVAQVLAAAAVIGALQMPVLEFDSDVPQFPVWTYLPVAVAGWLLASRIVRHLLGGGWWLVAAAGVYTGLRIGVVGLLTVLDHSSTVVPPVLALAVLDRAATRLPFRGVGRLVLDAVGATVVWFGWLAAVGGAATSVPSSVLPVGMGAAVLAALLVGTVSSSEGRVLRPLLGAGLLVVIAGLGLVTAPPADAHDPGQGSPRSDAVLTVERTSETSLEVDLVVGADSCAGLAPTRTLARRAGMTRVGVLTSSGRCRYMGVVEADATGRWFVYVELTDDGDAVELWAPLDDEEDKASIRRPLYEPASRPSRGIQLVAGSFLYAATFAMLAGVVRSSIRIGPATPEGVARSAGP